MRLSFFFSLVTVCLLLPSFTFAAVHGTVRDTDGEPVSGVIVTFTENNNPHNVFTSRTNSYGHYEIHLIAVDANSTKPISFRLDQNYPNPFNPSTTIPYTLSDPGHVTLTVYNVMGQRIRTLADGYQSAGQHTVTWDSRDDTGNSVSSGVYICQLRSGNQVSSKKMLLLDGGSFVAGSGSAPVYKEAPQQKPAVTALFTVRISGRDIIDHEETMVAVTDGMTLNYVVELVEIAETTKSIDDVHNVELKELDEDTLKYTVSGAPPVIKPNDIIVSSESLGYLRKVTEVSVAGNEMTVQTEPAVVTDAVVKGDVDTTFVYDFRAEKGTFKTVKGVSVGQYGFSLDGFKVFESDNVTVEITNGSIEFTPSLDIGGKIRGNEVKEFHAVATGELELDFDMAMSAGLTAGATYEKSLFGDNKPRKIVHQTIGSFPVVEVIEFDVIAGVEVVKCTDAGVTTGFGQTTRVTAGAKYQNHAWSPVWTAAPEFIKHEPVWSGEAAITVRAYVRPVLSVKFYANTGPYIDLIPFGRFIGEVGGDYEFQYKLLSGLYSRLDFDVSILGNGITNTSYNLAADSLLIAEFTKEKEVPIYNEYHGITFAEIEGGTFRMGDIQGKGFDHELPVHDVTLSEFEMSIFEITNAQYAQFLNEAVAADEVTAVDGAVMGNRGEYTGQPYYYYDEQWSQLILDENTFSVADGKESHPVFDVTWYGAKAFALYYGLDLPTEAEWEYACRAGTETLFHTGNTIDSDGKQSTDLDRAGWYNYNSATEGEYFWIHPVGEKEPNAWGLFDMHGNVNEWCHDWYGEYPGESVSNPSGAQAGSFRVFRGGCWCNNAIYCRSASRDYGYPGSMIINVGFRVVRRDLSHPLAPHYLIGRVLLNGAGLDGVTIGINSADAEADADIDATLSTDSNGNYLARGLYNGEYTVTASKDGYEFSRRSIPVTVNGNNIMMADIAATRFVSIPGGTFQMGDEVGDLHTGCRPVHTVTVSPFKMSAHEVTNIQYADYLNEALSSGDIEIKDGDVYGKTGEWAGQRYLDLEYIYNSSNKCWIQYSNDSFSIYTGYENRPVVAVTWYGAKSFALYYGFDLPTEAEWEYACRGGEQYRYGTDDGTIESSKVNYDRNTGHPVDVGSYPNNPFGLYDMSGNVWEWCNDWYGNYPKESVTDPTGAETSSYRVIRGGGWHDEDYYCRAAYRYIYNPDYRSYPIGFRVVRR